jgi:predicted adenylyl cyclase CyaB
MPINLEFKASIFSLQGAKDRSINIGAVHLTTLNQIDTYFNTNNGRLKLREINDSEAQLIYYERQENALDRWSNYGIYEVQDLKPLKDLLTKAYGVKVVVTKERDVYIHKNARIHIDKVEKLGEFIEFEVIHESDTDKTTQLLEFLKAAFKPEIDKVFLQSYADL